MVKKFIVISMLLFSANYGFSTSLKPYTEQDVLTAMDDICGDTWCEGDFGYSFKKVTCQSNSCTVKFQMTLETTLTDKVTEKKEKYTAHLNGAGGKYRYDVACVLSGMNSYNDMMRESDLSHQYYEPFTECIWDLEKMIRTHAY